MSLTTDTQDTLDTQTPLDWTTTHDTPAQFSLVSGPWELVVTARNPQEDNTWRVALFNTTTGDEYAVGPVEESNVPQEAQRLVDDHADE